MPNENDWKSYQRLVTSEMDENRRFRTEQRKAVADLAISVARLETKASLWGGLMGFIGGIITALLGNFGLPKVKIGA